MIAIGITKMILTLKELDTLDTGSIISLAMDISLVDELAPILGPTILGPKRLDSD